MKVFGANGRALINLGFVQQNITLPYNDYLPLFFWNTWYRDIAYYQYLFGEGPVTYVDRL